MSDTGNTGPGIKDKIKNERAHKALQDLLVDGEELLHVSFIHPAVFINSGLALLFGLALGIFFSWVVAFVVFVMAAYPFANALIRFYTTKLILTNKRVVAKYGFFNKDKIQIKLSRIESAHMETPLLGQFLGFGTVMIQGTGQGSIPITYISDAGDYVKKLEDLTLSKD